jgi:hypothetical protein
MVSMTPEQCREGRRLLGWSQVRLARAVGTHTNEISFERIGRLSQARSGVDRLAAIPAALEAAGVIFVDENGDGPGVRLRKEPA